MGQDVVKQLWGNRIIKHSLGIGAVTREWKSKQKTLVCVTSQQNTLDHDLEPEDLCHSGV